MLRLFLNNLLPDAEEFWKNVQSGNCESGTWIEQKNGGTEIALEARAMHLEGKKIDDLLAGDPLQG